MRICLWVVVLYAVTVPWRELGGVVDERLRWLAWFLLYAGVAVGFTVGRIAHDRRITLYPVLAVTATGLVATEALRAPDVGGVLVTALLAYAAGLDVAMHVRPRSTRDPWIPPWERF